MKSKPKSKLGSKVILLFFSLFLILSMSVYGFDRDNKPQDGWGGRGDSGASSQSTQSTENRGNQTNAANTAVSTGVWSESMYSRYTYESFSRTSFANASIDFNNVDYKLLGAAIFYATNIQRVRHGRSRFKFSAVLFKAAFTHSYDMVQNNFFSHTNPLPGKGTPSQRVRLFGQWKRTVGENIAYTFGIRYRTGMSFIPPSSPGAPFIDYSTRQPIPNHSYWSYALSVLVSWMNSPGHRRNILNARFGRLGAAGYLTYKGRYRMPYFKSTQVFAGDTND